MGVFDAFTEGKNGITAWIKWVHNSVPDKEGRERDNIRKELAAEKHCEPCTSLSGCYFVTDRMPGHLPPEMLHPRCDCTFKFIGAEDVREQIVATCDVRKFREYIFVEKGIKGGKNTPYEKLGLSIDDSAYLAAEYSRQAQEKYARGEYTLQKLDGNGQRINIELTIKNDGKTMTVKSGWLVHPLGYISAATPFLGYGERI